MPRLGTFAHFQAATMLKYTNTRENTIETTYLAPAGELLRHEFLDQQSTAAENVENVKMSKTIK